jgi:predicted nuclease of restriction endonuclease-like (RecB) superfamily
MMNDEANALTPAPETNALLAELRGLIVGTRERLAVTINRELTLLHWNIGKCICEDILREERAPYGEQIVQSVSRQLTEEFGRGFEEKSLRRMMQFAEIFPEEEIVATVSRQLNWSHFVEIFPLKEPLKRQFYAEMCRIERWSVRTLRAKINGMLYERTMLSGKTETVIQSEIEALQVSDQITPELVFRDPYLLDFLGLHDGYSERDLENAILREMEAFLLELGGGFTFVARQKRMTIDDEDFYLDLLFYHRVLRRLVAIELKIGKFTAAYKGQMELYLRWLNRYERQPGEESPIGLILCSQKSPQQIELLELETGDIRVAEFFTKQLPPAILEKELGKALHRAEEQMAIREKKEG